MWNNNLIAARQTCIAFQRFLGLDKTSNILIINEINLAGKCTTPTFALRFKKREIFRSYLQEIFGRFGN
jgi:hypothetical protein